MGRKKDSQHGTAESHTDRQKQQKQLESSAKTSVLPSYSKPSPFHFCHLRLFGSGLFYPAACWLLFGEGGGGGKGGEGEPLKLMKKGGGGIGSSEQVGEKNAPQNALVA